jgi:hypothetical protein
VTNLIEFSAIQAAAQVWLDTIANVRIHKQTHRRPVDLFQEDRLGPLNPNHYDVARTTIMRASSQFRIAVDANHYSVPCLRAPPIDRKAVSRPRRPPSLSLAIRVGRVERWRGPGFE